MTALRACPLVLLVGVLYFLLTAVRDDAKLKIVVEGQQIQFEPGYVRLRIRVEPDRQNRALAVGIVSAEYETSSLEQLNGDQAPISRWREFKDVPAGEYSVLAEVARADATSWYASTKLTVLARY